MPGLGGAVTGISSNAAHSPVVGEFDMPMSEEPMNDDLNWDLSFIQHRDRALSFLNMLGTYLSVYSESVEQLYTSYSIHLPKKADSRLVILPDWRRYDDTFNKIKANAVGSTGVRIYPKYQNQHGELTPHIQIPQRIKGADTYLDLPLSVGLRFLVIQSQRKPVKPFLPVLMKGDLRAFDANTPCLYLHNMKFEELSESELSDFEIKLIQKTLQDRVMILADKVNRINAKVI